ncbi:MAG: thiamine pyrophosphate-dependent dehydrogenase E1 component subunit alpha [Firmicutes bacterium]|nr:thiamine pyrophosphate-dependent dehydrogenase E1 component subunit alpha [Bacillota bacterium]
MLRTMIAIRRVEEEINNLFARGQIFGTTHLYAGQEAVAAGACYPLQTDDYVASTHRGHGHAIAKGVNIRQLAAELLGKDEGMCRGRGGTQHLSDLNVGFLGTNGITGGFIPIATGSALSFKMKGEKRVAVSFFGDGATNSGYFHESLNFASLYKLPVVYVCENNLYAMSIHVKKSTTVAHISERAAAYSMPGVTVDGMDPFKVEEVMNEALRRARNGEGPTLIEAETYRFHGHSKSDQRLYRTREEENIWRSRDPIEVLAAAMTENSIATEEEVNGIRESVFNEVRDAFQWASSLPEPPVVDLLQGVYS